MKRNLIIAIIFVLIGAYFISAQSENRIAWQNFDTGVKNSKIYKKKLIMDVYTNWCGWCKKMDSNTYADKQVSDYIKTKFIAIKINAESDNKLTFQGNNYTETQLARGLGINSYPSTVFFDENQKPITVIPGYIDANEFIYVLKYINEEIYKSKSYKDYRINAKI